MKNTLQTAGFRAFRSLWSALSCVALAMSFAGCGQSPGDVPVDGGSAPAPPPHERDVSSPMMVDAAEHATAHPDASVTGDAAAAVAPADASGVQSDAALQRDATSTPALSPDARTADVMMPAIPPGTVTGTVRGLPMGATATVLLGSGGFLTSQKVRADGVYRFEGVPAGEYFLKVDARGVSTGPARRIRVGGMTPQSLLLAAADTSNAAPKAASDGPVDFDSSALPAHVFRFHWEEDSSPAGYEEAANVVAPPKIEFLNEPPVELPDLAAADTLLAQFGVILSNEGVPWNQELAYRLLETMRSIPQPVRKTVGDAALVPSKWVLTDRRLEDDATLIFGSGGHTVTLSTEAFVYATPRLVLIDGQRARYFSKRLHHALVRYVTRNGQDIDAVEKILTDRFGCTTKIPDYGALTSPTTHEDAASFQPFHPAELVQIIDAFEEMPDGYHKVVGLKYLLRRKDGHPHPLYPAVPAVAWALPQLFPAGSYIEFMDSTFSGDPDHMHRLILHEKTHFLWGYVFSKALRDEWIALGGWYTNPSDPDGWSTSKTTEFVSAYAHKKNPDEDMAESVSYFVLNPAALQSRAPAKFAFIRDRIMQGTRYLSHIPKDLTFEVLNLFPDYVYPGKIKSVDITAEGAPDEDKKITVELSLHTADRIFGGASNAFFRLLSPIGTYEDMYVYPVDASGAVLRGQITISKYAKSGLWRPDQIVVSDSVGNQRLEGVNDYGWKLSLDNSMEDTTPPRYVPGSLTVQRFDDTFTENNSTHPVQRIEVRWRYEENRLMQRVYARFNNPAATTVYPLESYGTFDAATQTALVIFYVTPFMTSGDWSVPLISMTDAANNPTNQSFSPSPQHQPLVSIPIVTNDLDSEAPHVSLNDDAGSGMRRILVSAQPTNPDHPNGETLVVIRYQARDDKSGLDSVSYRLLDPQGLSHFQYHYHPNFYTKFFQGDPTTWTTYEIRAVLPVGSPPGTWGLQELNVRDKAGNQRGYNFVETLQFVVAP